MTSKITVNVYTGVTPVVNHYYSFVSEQFEVEPVKIARRPVGLRGADLKRYYYEVYFVGAEPMIECNQKSLAGMTTRENINRRLNPKWVPPKEGWIDNVWTPNN